MHASDFTSLADQVRNLAASGIAGRERRLHRLTDLYASAQAAAALQTAAAGAEGAVARILGAARAIIGSEIADPLRDETAAWDTLRDAVCSQELLDLVPGWIRQLRQIAWVHPESGACTIASALDLWLWTANHFLGRDDSWDLVFDELAEALCPLLAARALSLDVAMKPDELRMDLAQVQAARAAASASATCAELVFGYRHHLSWDEQSCGSCYEGDRVDELEGIMPGMASGARASGDVIEADGSHEAKRGPCARFDGLATFTTLRRKLDGCLSGARFARDRAATAILRSFVPAMARVEAS